AGRRRSEAGRGRTAVLTPCRRAPAARFPAPGARPAAASIMHATQAPERENRPMQLKDQSLFRQQCYIDGQWVDADGGGTVDVTNPADGSVLGTVPKMGAEETRRAIEAAERAWPAWRDMTAKERSAILRR